MKATPRHVRLNGSGIVTLIAVAAIVCGWAWGASEIYSRAKISERHAALYPSGAVSTEAQVLRLERRGENDRRTIVHYRYAEGGREHAGAIEVRRRDRDRYTVGSTLPIRYLATEPDASWLDGYPPERRPIWPAFVVSGAAIVAIACPLALIRRQRRLLMYGRGAVAVITGVEKKRSDKGTYWKVRYEWTVLSGAKRSGHYQHRKKQPPAVGTMIPIVYDRDHPSHHSRYPLSLVHVGR
jgi:hypothetical protein